ncbi:DUF1524 domain-containing protein [Brevibacterium sp. ZH18]|uniref:GmrSD restriction endonuclease domain-containing protein n=1 Tax=Brevibacterium sp. ZH18 TaxID=2927784 RepID=UPI001F601624|nr:DUF1524 domain-containing protein [Brevibacterium sp. ZH18]MCI4010365.1 DUF1524 domain-containing protein [Brevibacterium sp. ZH18]
MKRLGSGMVFLLISFLVLALLTACAEADGDASSDTGPSTEAAAESTAPSPTAISAEGRDAKDAEATAPADEDAKKDSENDQGRAGGSAPGTALAMLDELKVKGRAPKTGYDADLFKWRSDADHNGCDTRNDALRRDLRNITLKAGTNGCVVIKGTLKDKYKGETYAFDRSPNNIDIDHIVARSNAWQTGASKFDEDTLKEFGNDPLNLLAVSSSLNRQKGDGDAATWLPPLKSYRCEYVSRQIAIKHKYDLWVVKAEKSAMERVLASCDDQPAFVKNVAWPDPGEGDNVKTATEKKKPPKSSSSTTKGKSGSGRSGSGSTYFKNCTAARDAGAAPVRRGDPGYASHLDRDGDGVGCE